jgi:uncharacterized membrane protein YqhA
MGRLFGFSRYVVLIAVIGLLLASIAVYVFGGIVTVTVIVESFGHAEFNAEGSRAFSTEVIEVIDLFLLGTVLFMTSVGLYELFVDPEIAIPEWLSVGNVEQLKLNLVVVISVMLMVLFLGAAAGDWESGLDLLAYGGGIALVIVAGSAALLLLQRVHQHETPHRPEAVHHEAVVEPPENQSRP